MKAELAILAALPGWGRCPSSLTGPARTLTLKLDRFKGGKSTLGATIEAKRRPLDWFFEGAEEREEIEKKPRVRQLRQERRLPRILTEREMEALFARVIHLRKTHCNPRQRRLYLLHEWFLMITCFTGARLSKIFWLTWEQVDFHRIVIAVGIQTRFMVKESREKMLPMPPMLGSYLAVQRAAHPMETYLFDDGAGRPAYRDP